MPLPMDLKRSDLQVRRVSFSMTLFQAHGLPLKKAKKLIFLAQINYFLQRRFFDSGHEPLTFEDIKADIF
jgi:hypothetical protein